MSTPRTDVSEPTRRQIPTEVPLENVSKFLRFLPEAFRWQGVAAEAYKTDTSTYQGMTRFELLGKRGESPKFHVRYFEIAPGGYSTLEKHEHEHCVIPLRGRGEVQIGCRLYPLAFGDMVYVCPADPHQFRAAEDASEPFGFLCIVNAERDRPEPLDGLGVCEICE
ncbi:MAG: cupin domain-containing protein [Planctomycetes bacterium]|nr:cupin domain-containing protein [Planctomycetota bacterium]